MTVLMMHHWQSMLRSFLSGSLTTKWRKTPIKVIWFLAKWVCWILGRWSIRKIYSIWELLDVRIDQHLNFADQVNSLCIRTSHQCNNKHVCGKTKLVMNCYFNGKFNYQQLILMLHSHCVITIKSSTYTKNFFDWFTMTNCHPMKIS